jgi:hypothetical protein
LESAKKVIKRLALSYMMKTEVQEWLNKFSPTMNTMTWLASIYG